MVVGGLYGYELVAVDLAGIKTSKLPSDLKEVFHYLAAKLFSLIRVVD